MASQIDMAHEKEGEQQKVEYFKYSKRVVLSSVVGRDDGGIGLLGEKVVVGGWVKSCKEKAKKVVAVTDVTCPELLISRIPILQSLARNLMRGGEAPMKMVEVARPRPLPFVAYLKINDGSCVANLQVIVDSSLYRNGENGQVGASILVEGVIQNPSGAQKHVIELRAEKVLHVGSVDPRKYPLGKTRSSLDFTRSYPHLRSRTTEVACITRIRNNLSHATHIFFKSNGFIHVHMPVITTSSWETDSKMFGVTTLLRKEEDNAKVDKVNDKEHTSIETVRAAIKEKSARIEELKRSDSNKEVLIGALRDLQKANELARQLEKQQHIVITDKAGQLDFSADFFSRAAYLSASSELHLESYACSLSSVYAFGPTFQAQETIQATKDLAEKWVVEGALAFAELEDVMNCAEDCLKFLCRTILENCPHDIKFMSKRIDHNCIDHLKIMETKTFARVTYTEALEILKKADEKKFESQVQRGNRLSKEHESYLADEIFKQPVILYEYPKEIKPFYVRVRDDGRTVSAFDIIAPKVGVLVQGSQKEERINMIKTRIEEAGLPQEQLEWYLDLRKNGTVKHSGFSLLIENVVMFATGINDIRDAIPFPRTRGCANL